ncbi:MAG: hypothetical protein J5872_00315 [Lachnospiraceae bacterium]|nr:hypothetical protein [Lachnospiraceae bacterium]
MDKKAEALMGKDRFLTVSKVGRISLFSFFFESMGAVEMYLRGNPEVNAKSFPIMMSVRADLNFAGPPLEEAISYCTGGYVEGLEEFMRLSNRLETVNRQSVRQHGSEPAFVGNRPNVPAYIAGAPKTMYRLSRVVEKKVIRIYMNLAYSRNTTEEQIKTRGILALNLVRILERNNYIVDFRVFEASNEYNEYFLCEIMLKKPGQKLDPAKCYYPMCGRSFLRRVISRIKESTPFVGNWGMTYGKVADENVIKKILRIDENAIYIGTPQSMGIVGKDIRQDADAFLKRLKLSDRIRVPQYTEEDS